MVIQRHLKARDTDVFLTTFPKSGTTWLKPLLYATLRRTAHEPAIAPLTAHSPHQLVPFLESQVFINDQIPDLSSLPAPRLFMTHIPSQSLPDSITASDCKLRGLAKFVRHPFTAEEQKAGVDREIVEACGMESLAGLEVNRSGKTDMIEMSVANNIFFRRGVVGDWKNHLTPEMARRIDEITDSKED